MHSFTPPLCSHTEDPTFCSPLLSLNIHTLSNTHMQDQADIYGITCKHDGERDSKYVCTMLLIHIHHIHIEAWSSTPKDIKRNVEV